MKLYITKEEMRFLSESTNQYASEFLKKEIDNNNYKLINDIVNSTSAMLSKSPSSITKQYTFLAYNNICKLVQSSRPYIFMAHPSIEQIIRSRHTGSTLYGFVIKPKRVLMQVARDTKGNCWFISDRPINIDKQHPITITSKGSGYFEYHGPDAPIGSDYYIEEFKEW